MAMFLVVGCQTTQSAETETKPKVVKEVQALPKEKEVVAPKQKQKQNPYQGIDIPAHAVVTSSKPVLCGRIDIILGRMKERFGEVPVFLGKMVIQNPVEGEKQVVAVLVFNSNTGSYTFLEQMSNEKRLMCILSSGQGKLNSPPLGNAL